VKTISNVNDDSGVGLNDSQAAEVLREWRESAFYWQKHADTIRTMFGPITQALIQAAEIVEGDVVLDVAGGAGEPSLTIAKTIGPTGSVTCTDVTAEMVAAAQSEAKRHGVTNIAFRQCGADSLPFENNSFDAVVCRLGVMFFPDPLAGLREMLRVAKREGVLSLAGVGQSRTQSVFFLITDVLARHFGEPRPPTQMRPARFGSPSTAVCPGFLRKRELSMSTSACSSFRLPRQSRQSNFGSYVQRLRGRFERSWLRYRRARWILIAQEAQEAVRQYFSNNQMSIPAQMIVVTGRKP
jgi:SAM-dependent methyltransferase